VLPRALAHASLQYALCPRPAQLHVPAEARHRRDDDPEAVVDSKGRVRGVGGLRVVDASIMPTLVTGNPNIPTIMMAEKIADSAMADGS